MGSNEIVFRHRFINLALMAVGVFLLGYAVFVIGRGAYFLITITGIAFVVVLFYVTSSVRISNETIKTSSLFGSKSLKWSEIERLSIRGEAIRLHNRAEDITLTISSQLDDYEVIPDMIFSKRPDLFDDSKNRVMSTSWLVDVLLLVAALLIMAGSVLQFFRAAGFDKIYPFIFFLLSIDMILYWLSTAKGITLENKTLLIIYLFRDVSYAAEDIYSISFKKIAWSWRPTWDGYFYFVQIALKSGKKFRLPTLTQGPVLTYQILRRWHKNAISNEPH